MVKLYIIFYQTAFTSPRKAPGSNSAELSETQRKMKENSTLFGVESRSFWGKI